MKKSVFLRSALLLLVLAMVGATLFAGNTTLARYRATAVGASTAEIARFDVLIGDAATGVGMVAGMTRHDAAAVATALDLFTTIIDTIDAAGNPGATFTDRGETATDQVREERIAPGTRGALEVQVTNLSDVRVAISFDAAFNAAGAPTPGTAVDLLPRLQWRVGGTGLWGNTGAGIPNIAPVELARNGGAGSSATVILEWRWPFMDGSECDPACPVPCPANCALPPPHVCIGPCQVCGSILDTPIGVAANGLLAGQPAPHVFPVDIALVATQVD